MRMCTGAPEPFFGPGVVVGAGDDDECVVPPADAEPPDAPDVHPASTTASSTASTGSARIPLAPVRGPARTGGTSTASVVLVQSWCSFVRLQGDGVVAAFRWPGTFPPAPGGR